LPEPDSGDRVQANKLGEEMICSDEAYEAMLKDHATSMRVSQESIERLSKALHAAVEREKVLEGALVKCSEASHVFECTAWCGPDNASWTESDKCNCTVCVASKALARVKAMREGK
jgi:hypothetical protein